MKRFVKIVGFIVVFALLTGVVLSGCTIDGHETQTQLNEQKKTDSTENVKESNFNETGYPIVNEMVTFKLFAYKDVTHAPYDENLLFTELEKKTNVKIEWETVDRTVGTEKRNIMLASGDYPDAFFNCNFNANDLIQYGSSEGIFIPLTELIGKYGVNISAIFEKYPSIKASITALDGNIYSFPAISIPLGTNISPKHINKKWLDKLSLPVPETLDDYYNVLKAFKTKDPNGNSKSDELPITGWYDKSGNNDSLNLEVSYILGSYGVFNNVITRNAFNNTYLDDDGKLKYTFIDEKYRKTLDFMIKLSAEDLIDDDIYTQTKVQATAKGVDLIGSLTVSFPEDVIAGSQNGDYIPLSAMKGPNGDHSFGLVQSPVKNPGKFVITNKCKNPEILLRWIDFFYGSEGEKAVRLGVEGKTYVENPDGTYDFTDFVLNNPDGLNVTEAIGKFTIYTGTGAPYAVLSYNALVSRDAKILKSYEDAVAKDLPDTILPSLFMSPEERESINAIDLEIINYVNEMRTRFIKEKKLLDDATWNSYVETIEKMGVNKVLEVYQTVYDRNMK